MAGFVFWFRDQLQGFALSTSIQNVLIGLNETKVRGTWRWTNGEVATWVK